MYIQQQIGSTLNSIRQPHFGALTKLKDYVTTEEPADEYIREHGELKPKDKPYLSPTLLNGLHKALTGQKALSEDDQRYISLFKPSHNGDYLFHLAGSVYCFYNTESNNYTVHWPSEDAPDIEDNMIFIEGDKHQGKRPNHIVKRQCQAILDFPNDLVRDPKAIQIHNFKSNIGAQDYIDVELIAASGKHTQGIVGTLLRHTKSTLISRLLEKWLKNGPIGN